MQCTPLAFFIPWPLANSGFDAEPWIPDVHPYSHDERPEIVSGGMPIGALLATACAAEIELTLQTRDPATGRVILTQERVDPARVGVIAVDVWNFHWCKTATMRVDAIVPRLNRALEAARAMGMTVMLVPAMWWTTTPAFLSARQSWRCRR